MEVQLPEVSLRMMAPELFLFVWALVVITFDVVTKRAQGESVGYLTMVGIAITGGILAITGEGPGFGNMFYNDPMAIFFKIIFLGAAFMAVGSSFGLTKQKIVNHRGEFFGLMLLSTVGMMFLASANELLTIWIGLELTTIPLFVLAAFFKDNKLSVESGLKYFIVGAFSSAVMVYGLSFLYGLTGTTDLLQMKLNLATVHLTFRNIGVILIAAITMLIAGIGFKLGLPPFHQWVPDVYEGAPTPVAAFLSIGSKAAGLAAFAKIFVNGLSAFHGVEMAPNDWGKLAGIVAIAALILGNTVAIRQTNIKRMLGYSSIAQAGYIMIGMVAQSALGLSAVAFYIFAYMFANMGAFAVVTAFEDKTGSCEIKSYAGLAKTSPMLSICMTIFLLSLAGIPPLAGFLAKYFVFAAAIKQASLEGGQWLYWVVGAGLITAVFSLYYYANVIKQMYFSKDDSPYRVGLRAPAMLVVLIGLAGVLVFGLYPEPVLRFAGEVPSMFGFVSP
jgi:NADH-quinone oxidoreductase subunit N